MYSFHHLKIQKFHGAITGLMGIVFLSLWPSLGSSAPALPTLPQAFINTTYVPPSGNTITVNAGGNLQAALNNAQLGDTIVLQAGATFTGPFTLPNKTSGSGWIYIRSSNYSKLPAPGNRVAPTDAANMPKIVIDPSQAPSAVQTALNAHHYRFVGIEIKPVTGKFAYNLITIGNENTSLGTLSHDITFDRCYIHGDPTVGGRRGVAMDGRNVAVIDSYVSDFKEAGADTQALWAYNSPGPFKITNNYLEASGESVVFGGVDPKISNLVPSDIEIRRNSFSKPLSWVGSKWTVKNLLEFKNAQRVLIEGNYFENNWAAAQNGFSVLVTPRNQNGTAPWSVTKDITFRLNTMKNVQQGINLSGYDDLHPSQQTRRVLIQNNVIQTGFAGTGGQVFQFINGVADVTVDHNTAFTTRALAVTQSSPPVDQFAFTNNIGAIGLYGFFGSGTAGGTATLNKWFTNWSFVRNALFGDAQGNSYPSDNYLIADVSKVGFVDYQRGDYHLLSSSTYKNAGTDGKDLGADINAISNASIGVGGGGGTLTPPLNLRTLP